MSGSDWDHFEALDKALSDVDERNFKEKLVYVANLLLDAATALRERGDETRKRLKETVERLRDLYTSMAGRSLKWGENMVHDRWEEGFWEAMTPCVHAIFTMQEMAMAIIGT